MREGERASEGRGGEREREREERGGGGGRESGYETDRQREEVETWPVTDPATAPLNSNQCYSHLLLLEFI